MVDTKKDLFQEFKPEEIKREEDKQKLIQQNELVNQVAKEEDNKPTSQYRPGSFRENGFRPRGEKGDRPFKKRPFMDENLHVEVVKIGRVTKVVKGGRRFRFAAIVIVGDKKGKVGFGKGKANEVPDAIRKAKQDAQKNMFRIKMNKKGTITHDVIGKYGSTSVLLKPSNKESGIVAGGAVRLFLETAGIKNIYTKVFGARNPMNMIRAVLNAFEQLTSWREVALNRGLAIEDKKETKQEETK